MIDPLKLSINQEFERERMARVIDSTTNVSELREVAKQLLTAWLTQQAASQWILKSSLVPPEKKI
jgi:hypothetical protein